MNNKKNKVYPKPIRIEIVNGKITIVKDRLVIIPPVNYNVN